MGKRIDVVLIIENVIFILEFKVGEKEYLQAAVDQVWDYSLDLKNFHETSASHLIAPILVATKAKEVLISISTTNHNDNLLFPIKANSNNLLHTINAVLEYSEGENIDSDTWLLGRYSPTPTIIEAAMALYNGHTVADISRSDATAQNLSHTSDAVSDIIKSAKKIAKKQYALLPECQELAKPLLVSILQRNILTKTKALQASSYQAMAHLLLFYVRH
jgi:hypothetical protein